MNENSRSKEIDIIGITKEIFVHYKTLAGFLIVFAVLGVVVALDTPKSYTTNVVLAPEIGSSTGVSSNLSDLASMVGVDLSARGNNIDAIYPEIYPDVFASNDFILSLFDIQVKTLKTGETKTYYQHLTQDRHIPFWSWPSIWISQLFQKKQDKSTSNKINPFQLTKGQNDVVSIIRSDIGCTIDKKTSVITITVKDLDPMVSAIMADTLCTKLQSYITEYRTHKARTDLRHTEALYREAKRQYEKIRQMYGTFSDANTDLVLESVKSKQEDLENEMQLRFNTYTQMSQQLQMAKAKLQEQTPAFTVIQKASVPLRASSTPRLYTVLGFIFAGGILGSVWILFLQDLVNKILLRRRHKA